MYSNDYFLFQVLHRDIENHGKIVGSVVKLCKRTDSKCNTTNNNNARRIANGLERRWHLLFLRSLEWQCYLESLSKKQNLRVSFDHKIDAWNSFIHSFDFSGVLYANKRLYGQIYAFSLPIILTVTWSKGDLKFFLKGFN